MGDVYLAEDLLMERQVAVKVISDRVRSHPTAVDRFLREIRAAARLDHPNIVRAHHAEQVGELLFLVSEFVEGDNLGEVVDACGPLPVREACDYVRQAALGLQHAHEQEMVHRDLKPHNLMLTPKGQVKILDFGIARSASESSPEPLTAVRSLVGTPDYMAPEQADDARRADIRADVYSLGCTFYHLLAGRPPFAGGSITQKLIDHKTRTPAPLREHGIEVPAGLEAVLRRMLAKEPAARFQTPAEVAEALEPFTREPAEPADGGGRPGPTGGRRSRWLPWVAAAGVLATAGLVGGAIYSIKTDKGELVIETVDEDVEVVIRRGGKEVAILDGKTKRRVTLPSGKLSAELKGAPGLILEADEFVLKRGGEVIVKVTRKPLPRIDGVGRGDQPPVPPKATSEEVKAAEAIVAKLGSALDVQVKAAIDQAHEDFQASQPKALVEMAGGDVDRARVLYTKMKLIREFPELFEDIHNYPDQFAKLTGDLKLGANRNYLLMTAGKDVGPSDFFNAPAVSLFLALSQGRRGRAFDAETAVGPGGIRTMRIRGVDFKVFVDSWGNPIRYIRWPTAVRLGLFLHERPAAPYFPAAQGVHAELNLPPHVQPGAIADPLDPLGTIYRLPSEDKPWSMSEQGRKAAELIQSTNEPWENQNLNPIVFSDGPNVKDPSDNIYSFRLRKQGD